VHIIDTTGNYSRIKLGMNFENGEVFQAVVPLGSWFGATLQQSDTFALVGCTVAPGFDFADFEIAERDVLVGLYPEHRQIIEQLTR